MRLLVTWWLLAMACCWPGMAGAELRLLPDQEPQRVFAGEAQQITVVWRNDSGQNFEGEIRARILQSSSATVVPLGELRWKQLQVLPQQTILESATLDFQAVKTETKFLVQWLENTNRVIGTTKVLVYPTNLLAELKPLLNGQNIGVLDPANELKPLLRQNGVTYLDLGEQSLEDFSGTLAILGPFTSKAQMPNDLIKCCKTMVKKNVAVVWIQPPTDGYDKLQPSFYTVSSGTNAIVIVQAGLVARLAEQPQSQQRLMQFCRLALNPEPVVLPTFYTQP